MGHTLSGRLWHRCEQFGAEPARTLLGRVGAASLAIKYYVVARAKAALPLPSPSPVDGHGRWDRQLCTPFG